MLSFEEVFDIMRPVEGWFDKQEAKAMYHYANEFPEGSTFVEIGSYRGRSAILLGLAAKEIGGRHYAIDPHFEFEEPNEKFPMNVAKFSPADHAIKMRNIVAAGLEEYVFPICLPSQWVSVKWELPISLLFIDGEHTEKAAQQDLFGYHRYIDLNGIIAIHDAYWSGPIKIAEILRESPDFVELPRAHDTFFFRRELPKDSLSHEFWQGKTIEFYESINN